MYDRTVSVFRSDSYSYPRTRNMAATAAAAAAAAMVSRSGPRVTRGTRFHCCLCSCELACAPLLSCLHSICMGCLAEAMDKDGRVCCRTCQYVSEVDADRLPLDVFAADRVTLKRLLDTRKQPVCDDCGEEADEPASHLCADCGLFLCDVHHAGHSKGKLTRGHSMQPIAKLRRTKVRHLAAEGPNRSCQPDLASVRRQPTCAIHPGKEIQLYCTTCRLCICHDCSSLKHSAHSVSVISPVPCNTELDEQLLKAKQWAEKVETALTDVRKHQDCLTADFHSASSAIDKAGEEARKALDKRLEELRANVDSLYIKRSKSLESRHNQLEALREGFTFASEFTEYNAANGSNTQCLMMRRIVENRFDGLSNSAQSMIDSQPPVKKPLLNLARRGQSAAAPAFVPNSRISASLKTHQLVRSIASFGSVDMPRSIPVLRF